MNAVEIEEAISALVEQAFDPAEFPYLFLQAFGNKETTIRKLRAGASNKSDLAGGVLQTSNIHIIVAAPGEVTAGLGLLKASPATARAKAKFVLATDGDTFEAEDLASGETVACEYADFPNHFGFFLPLAGITTVKEIRESSFDIRATGRLNRLYRTLLEENADWDAAERRAEMNHFMARLIFCFFAEDTDIFNGTGLFTATVEQMSARDSSNTHEIIGTLFRAMNTKIAERKAANLPRWADAFPYVNGELFSGSIDVPHFSKIARSYLIHIGNLDWTKINPDIFGSMIQAVADDEERGALGMHYTSVPNILKVLNPLFLDDLRTQLEEVGDNPRMLLNLRKRMGKIRVFDPACGSGNFLVIAYKAMREIEAEINQRRGEVDRRTEIRLTNFRGIELRDFPAEVARLALIIAEFQCDVLYRGQKEALAEFLPLDAQNWITCGNALRLDWLSVCPPTGTGVRYHAEDLFSAPLDQAEIDFENEGGETYICGNPPYKGNADQTKGQKDDIRQCFSRTALNWKSFDYICAWFWKAARYTLETKSRFAFVSTNSISQGQSISYFWQPLLADGLRIDFAVRSFRWRNLATENATVTVVIVGCSRANEGACYLFDGDIKQEVVQINPYLVSGKNVFIERSARPLSALPQMVKGNYYGLSEGLLLNEDDRTELLRDGLPPHYIKTFKGGAELVRGTQRWCLWFPQPEIPADASQNLHVMQRIASNRESRLASPDTAAIKMAERPHQFREMHSCKDYSIAIPNVSSESRPYLPVTLESSDVVFPNTAFALYDTELSCLAIAASRLHLVWTITVCGKLETRIRYSNTLGWNTLPVPTLTEKNKADLTRCAEDILLTREAHFPSTIADLYDPENMPADLREAHDRNDEVLERIYIGRRFRNDTERLEKLFELYTKMIASPGAGTKKKRAGASA
ncbi:MAG: class I SAM-dependent DNA methyltransferase [Mesorhizobium sp.]|uniref:class I SAM-dependent DNA methyltransferase n=1 Tax=Mesorhizobium sp. TaxID=1871066 RepID=UPI000FD1AE21|nr:DNA methyltransferase [Mesorhizobium sp.]RVD74180.1 class I SAM-dependent DNA methyltransferase [Mesorhizobium sp. M4A.F.Ca.ET.029.04.2.1]TIW36308.1 MAG: class I SAM-dependent DNA methyltransferase [Mesorhizobium sp.]